MSAEKDREVPRIARGTTRFREHLESIQDKGPLKLAGEPARLPEKGKPWYEEQKIPMIEPEQEAVDMEGDVVSIDQLAGFCVSFHDVLERQSRYAQGKSYVYAQVTVQGEPYTLRTGSEPVVRAILKQAKEGKLPFRAYVEARKTKKGMTCYVLTDKATADQEAK